MANSAQARKRARQAEKHRQQNVGQRTYMRTTIKRVVGAISSGEKENATVAYKVMVSTVDRMVGAGLIHKNKAARHKSRLNAQIKVL